MNYRRHWIALGIVAIASFAILGNEGVRLERNLPPIPTVTSETGEVLFDKASIQNGQNVWQSIGGQQVGSIWGHGAYVAPDWTADWLHRESMILLDGWAKAEGAQDYAALDVEKQAALQARLQKVIRTNRYDQATDTLKLQPERVAAYEQLAAYYANLFTEGHEQYAIQKRALTDPAKLQDLARFFWWTSWVASTERPGMSETYTQNFPHEPLVANKPTSGALVWSILSVILLIAGIGAIVAYRAKTHEEEKIELPAKDPFTGLTLTASQKATFKYFFVVALLIVTQVGLGGIIAHYGVEGWAFYGFPISDWLPYSVARSWHTQIGIFWIATAWLATGLFLAPLIGGVEPKFQRLGVNVLFFSLLTIVVGTMVGQWLSVQQKLGGDVWYWLGHQGYEYVDLGRFWQIFLFAGLFIWLGLMVRALLPALKRKDEGRPLLVLFVLSAAAIGLFYGAGLMYGQKSHLATVEYWRWWVVHLWVEGFFEVFATVAVSFLFVKMGVLKAKSVTPAVLFATIIFLAGGIVGTLHHLYFTGTPQSALALGAVFSALEIVPLSLIGYEVWQNLKLIQGDTWMTKYKWPIRFFVAVAFWNLVGAGVFGFLINPPIALYYMQGLNLTPLHGHTALFGVYGSLGIGLMLFSLRAMDANRVWKDRPLKIAFWGVNGGLVAMSLFSLLPVGLMQTYAAIDTGLWYARSAEFLNGPLITVFKWMRGPGDTLFAVGVVSLAWFVVGLKGGWSIEGEKVTHKLPKPVPAPKPELALSRSVDVEPAA